MFLTDYELNPINIAILVVAALIVLVALFSVGVSIYLAVSYDKFNRKENSIKKSGQDVARTLLDENGLEHIKVSPTGSILFGNSYSHYFKKVRLRRRTYKKSSVASLGMAAQKTALALLDKEGDPDMKKRVRLIPFVTFGPFMFLPLLLVGVLLDIIIFKNDTGTCTIICASIGLVFYLCSFILSFMTLKTEVKAQARAYQMLKDKNYATDEELGMLKKLFKLYNIEYINNMILEMLELILRILQLVSAVQSNNNSSSSKD